MVKRLIWTSSALRNLDKAAEYIYEDSPYYASALVKKALDAASSLKEFPKMGRAVPELGNNHGEVREK